MGSTTPPPPGADPDDGARDFGRRSIIRRRGHGPTVAAALALSLGAFVVGAVACRRAPTHEKTTASPVEVPSSSAAPVVDGRFCGQGLVAIRGGGCLAMPDGGGHVPLVIYFHGLHDDTTAAEELGRQARVASLGARHRARFATLAFHGKKGDCTNARVDSLYCWPSNARTEPEAPAIVASFAESIAEAEARGARGKRFLLGFSNGGYFAMLLAQRALLRADGVVVAHAGPMSPTVKPASAPPLLLLGADDDAAVVDMLRLSRELGAVGWPHTLLSRDGSHALPESDVALALDFFDATMRGAPLAVPALAHPPRPTEKALAAPALDASPSEGATTADAPERPETVSSAASDPPAPSPPDPPSPREGETEEAPR